MDPQTPFVDSSPSNGYVAPSSAPAGKANGGNARHHSAPVDRHRNSDSKDAKWTTATTTTAGHDNEEGVWESSKQATAEKMAAAAERGGVKMDGPENTRTAHPTSLSGPTGRVKRWGDPNDPMFGDVHYYDYGMDCEDAESYPRYGGVA